MRFTIGLILTSLRSWRYCAVVEWDLAKPREIEIGISKPRSHSLFWITAPPQKFNSLRGRRKKGRGRGEGEREKGRERLL